MAKVLVAEDERNVRLSLVYILYDAGYDVIEAKNGAVALQMATQEQPDLILLDVMMPMMNGFEVLKRLRENSATETIPVVLLTALPPREGEQDGLKLGVAHYITKPWKPGMVELTVKVALRDSGKTDHQKDDESLVWAGATSYRKTPGGQEVANTIKLGEQLALLEKKLDGGLTSGSLTLIEGATSAGTSILGQHLVYGALEDGRRVTCFSSEHTAISMAKQMSSIGLGVSKYLQDQRLNIFPVEEPIPDEDRVPMLGALALDMERLAKENEFIVVDAITNLAGYSQDQSIIGFFSACKRVCAKGMTVVIVVHSYAFDEGMLVRLSAMCDAHLKLRVGKMKDKVVRVAEVVKVNSVELDRDNTVSFEVEAGSGIRFIHFSQAKV